MAEPAFGGWRSELGCRLRLRALGAQKESPGVGTDAGEVSIGRSREGGKAGVKKRGVFECARMLNMKERGG